jgi:hypothetical protein
MTIEIALIIIWVFWFAYALNFKLKKLTFTLLSGFIVGVLFIWLDNYYGQITYTTNINIPGTNYPISIIALASLYFVSIIFLRAYVLKKIFPNRKKPVVGVLLGFFVTAVLNILYPVVDFTIVNMQGGVFTNEHINQFYTTFEYHPDIQQYQLYAYVFFLLAIYLSQGIALMFYKLYGFVSQYYK